MELAISRCYPELGNRIFEWPWCWHLVVPQTRTTGLSSCDAPASQESSPSVSPRTDAQRTGLTDFRMAETRMSSKESSLRSDIDSDSDIEMQSEMESIGPSSDDDMESDLEIPSSEESLDEAYITVKELSKQAAGQQAYVRFALPRSAFNIRDLRNWKPEGNVEPPKLGSKLVVVKHLTINDRRKLPLRPKDFDDELRAMHLVNGLRGKPNHASKMTYFPNLLQYDPARAPLWFAMERVNGATVQDWQNKRRRGWDAIPRAMVYHIFAQTLEAIEWLYRPGLGKPWSMEHEDLHTGNIMLDVSKARPLTSREDAEAKHLP